ncbi:MAG: alpha/beta hydrolase [Verrucomicrobium sp.]|nr:alpha/beta hydrolase [Verrucomicrobium sp.]
MNASSSIQPAKPNAAMQAILDAHTAMGPLPIETLTPEQARLIPLPDRAAIAYYGQHFTKKALAPLPLPVGETRHLLIPTAEGRLVARLYTPKGEAPEEGWPLVVYFHGGGWVLANLDTYDASCRALCNGAEAMVLAVHYRQAPEHPWPAAMKDAYAAFEWAAAHAPGLDADPNRIAVAGESAGGNLAAVVSQIARDKEAQLPLHQLLIYPVTDLLHGIESPSAEENAEARPLNRAMLRWFYGHYVPEREDRSHPYISPLYGETAGLPPATVILAQIDPLRSDGEAYAVKMAEADVPVTLKIYEGVTHEFFGMAGLIHEATDAVALASKELRQAFDEASRALADLDVE